MEAWTYDNILADVPLRLAALSLLLAAFVAWVFGELISRRIRPHLPTEGPAADRIRDQEGFMVGSVLGLLALLLGFTFALAVDRFEARRQLVLDEANTITDAYLRAQLLDEPHRTELSRLLVAYTDNRLSLAKLGVRRGPDLLKRNDELVAEIWQATKAAFPTVRGIDFSSTWIDTMNHLVNLDLNRKTARLARVPAGVFLVLFVYYTATAGLLGYTLGKGLRIAGGILLSLFALSLVLAMDIDQPIEGLINESQRPMEMLRANMTAANIAPPRVEPTR